MCVGAWGGGGGRGDKARQGEDKHLARKLKRDQGSTFREVWRASGVRVLLGADRDFFSLSLSSLFFGQCPFKGVRRVT